jgi:hypothetical protein
MLSEITAGVNKKRKELFIQQKIEHEENIVVLPLNLSMALLANVAYSLDIPDTATIAEIKDRYKHLL